jgi:hypothetical protein
MGLGIHTYEVRLTLDWHTWLLRKHYVTCIFTKNLFDHRMVRIDIENRLIQMQAPGSTITEIVTTYQLNLFADVSYDKEVRFLSVS